MGSMGRSYKLWLKYQKKCAATLEKKAGVSIFVRHSSDSSACLHREAGARRLNHHSHEGSPDPNVNPMKNKKVNCICGFLLVLIAMAPQTASAQVLRPDADSTYFSEMWNVFNSHKRLSYISLPPRMRVNGRGGFPVLFEAVVSPYFTFFRGRDYGDVGYSVPQLKSFMIYFNPELTLRMYREEPIGTFTKSLPVLPINFAPRISFVKFFHKTLVENKVSSFRNYHFAEFSVAHYSNGQEDPHHYQDSIRVNGDSIPNFRSGNFSTNYLRLGYTRGWMDEHFNILSVNPYIQNDGGWGDLFSYDRAQDRNYGRWRLGTTVQLQSKKTWAGSKGRQKVQLDSVVTITQTDTLVQLKPRREKTNYYITWRLRVNYEFIADNVSDYPSGKPRRSSVRTSLLLHPLNWRNFGVLVEYYHGRDFYNIRFYDQLSQFKIALVADPQFYLPRNAYWPAKERSRKR
jgi:hypothetical protein